MLKYLKMLKYYNNVKILKQCQNLKIFLKY